MGSTGFRGTFPGAGFVALTFYFSVSVYHDTRPLPENVESCLGFRGRIQSQKAAHETVYVAVELLRALIHITAHKLRYLLQELSRHKLWSILHLHCTDQYQECSLP